MKLSQSEVEHIASLARLRLSQEEKEIYGEQLSAILDYVEKMNSVDTELVEPTSQVTGLVNVMREDKVGACSLGAELVATAPESRDNFLVVPKIFENK